MSLMSTQWDRLNSELSKKHKSWASLADYLGLKKQNVGNWKSRGIPAKYLRKCAEFVSRTHDWLDIGDEPESKDQHNKDNQPPVGVFIASSAIDINSVRHGQPSAHEVVEALVVLMAAIEPGRRDALATLASGLARNPSDTLLADLLVKILEPAAFAQPDQRTG